MKIKKLTGGRVMSQEEIYEQAESNFQAIASKYIPQPSKVDFMRQNITNLAT